MRTPPQFRARQQNLPQAAPPATVGREIKIEIGSGGNPQPGYLHLDCRQGLPHLDIAADIVRHLPFKDGTVSELLSHSSIEHVSWRKVGELLADWFRVLKPGGRVIIYTPDFRYLCRSYLEGKTDQHIDKTYIDEARRVFGTYTPSAWAMMKMFAGQEYAENFHFAAYDFELLKSVLETTGFSRITRIPPEYSLRVVAEKGRDRREERGERIEERGHEGKAGERREERGQEGKEGDRSTSVQLKTKNWKLETSPPATEQKIEHPRPPRNRNIVHVNLVDRGWILERMGAELERRLDYVSLGDGPDPDALINYHINYHAFKRKNRCDVALFTHMEERDQAARGLFFTAAKAADHCVCMSNTYAGVLRENGITRVTTIMPGIELEAFTPELRIGVVGRTYHTGRKGEELVARAMAIPFTSWYFCGEGWPEGGVRFDHGRLAEFYRSIDILLVPALYEGGPMPVLEALASGKQVLSPPVGFVPEFPHIEYKAGDFESLQARIGELLQRKLDLRASVEQRTWQRWAAEHHRLFLSLLPQDENIIEACTLRPVPTAPSRPRPSLIQALPVKKTAPAVVGKAGDKLRILLVARNEALTGGPSIRIPVLQEKLTAAGHEVAVSYDPEPDPAGFDVAHVFNVWAPRQALPQMRRLRQSGVPLVLSPIFLDLAESVWAQRVMPLVFAPANDEPTRTNYLDAIANGSLMLENRSRFQGVEIYPGADAEIREVITLADRLITLSTEEMQRISKCLGIPGRPFTIVHNAADYAAFENASPDLFVKKFGLRDFVLCVGRVEARKNQLLLLHALRDSGLPVVIAGRTGEPTYEALCRSIAPQALFIPHLDRQELASAFAAARVCAQPSWAEGASLVCLEAAAAACPLVVSNRSSEFEYFGDAVRYCEPSNWRSIAQAVRGACEAADREKPRRVELRERLKQAFTWDKAAEETMSAYRQAIG